MSELKPAVIDDITVTKDDVVRLRDEVIGWRDRSMEQWPDAIPFTVTANFLIGLLAWVTDIYPEEQ